MNRLIEKFGNGLKKIIGLLDFLENQDGTVEDVQVSEEENVAAFVLDKHWWSGSSGIGMAAIAGVYRDGKSETESFTYRDQYDARKDRWYLAFNKVKIIEVKPEFVKIQVIAKNNQKEITFFLKAEPKAVSKNPKVSQKEKKDFELHVAKEMEKTEKDFQHNHPLYQKTYIPEKVVKPELKIAAFILFEQIDTDRCTPQSPGWLGDQYRYSIWIIKNKEQAVQLYEDHAYTKQRGCDIRGIGIFDGKILATDYSGKEIKLEIPK